MANPARRLPKNSAGDFFVDDTCIDCDACRQIAPMSFRECVDKSVVYHQPETLEETRLALMALVACPTGSIGATGNQDKSIGIKAFPTRIAENIYFCGFNAEASFGAWSYLIVRPIGEGGNILIDSPRFAGPLIKAIQSFGGISRMFLTHRDDVADHASFRKKFHCERIMHAEDGAGRLGIEKVIDTGKEVRLDDDLIIIPVPGHTRGHMLLLYKQKFLFTGDHLSWSNERDTLTAFRSVAWYSWREQTRSMEKLLNYNFEWVLPGHGRIHYASPDEMRRHLKSCITWMKANA